ncbi:uncharacterized protein LOC119839550 [Zerene cesonia]|uniref:uncharacterized protein LOC119839550 n=1 Tax=Zerene cesonia TaxID=33412 RepID=UPI0018E50B89|nr:uncharacterized protein LOC119839550 [Zerene cesonia]
MMPTQLVRTLGTTHIYHSKRATKSTMTLRATRTRSSRRRRGSSASSTTTAASTPSSMRTSSINAAPPLCNCRRCLRNNCRHHLDIQTIMKWRRTDRGRDVPRPVCRPRHHQRRSEVARCPCRQAASRAGAAAADACRGPPPTGSSPYHPPAILMCLTRKKLRERYPMLVMVSKIMGIKNTKTLPLNSIQIIIILLAMKMGCNLSLMRLPMRHPQQQQHKRRLGVRRRVQHSFHTRLPRMTIHIYRQLRLRKHIHL